MNANHNNLNKDAPPARWLETSVAGIIGVGEFRNIVFWNNGAEKIFQYKTGDIIGRSVMQLIPEENAAKEAETILKAIHREGYLENYQTTARRKDGTHFPVLVTISSVKNEAGEIIGGTYVFRDITEQLRLEAKLKAYAKELEEVNKTLRDTQQLLVQSEKQAAIGVLAAGIAHEIGNPLSSISSLVQLHIRRETDPNILKTMGQISNHVSRITKIINSLVDFARPRQNEKQTVSIDTLLKFAVKIATFTRNARRVDIVTDIDESLPQIVGSPADILQAIVNVVINSIDAVSDNDGKINISSKRVNGSLLVEVSDNGIGIAEEHKKKVFQPFFTTKEVGAGAGLGLAVSDRLVRSLGGSINIKSQKGKGTQVSILLPIQLQ